MGQLHQQILLLSREERLQLLQYIVDSIRFEETDTTSNSVSAAQGIELQRRSQKIQEGTAEFLTWQEIKGSLKK